MCVAFRPKRAAVLVVAATLAACATEDGYRRNVEAMIGQTEATLVSTHGVPDATHRADGAENTADEKGAKFVTYRRGSTDTIPGYCSFVPRIGYYCAPPQTYTYVCITTFRIEGGIVRSWTSQGNACRA